MVCAERSAHLLLEPGDNDDDGDDVMMTMTMVMRMVMISGDAL